MDIICFSHLRWNFVYQRPQHLLKRFARSGRVFYVEEPFLEAAADAFTVQTTPENVFNVQLHLAGSPGPEEMANRQAALLQSLFEAHHITRYLFWFYTPMALAFSRGFTPRLTVYDCMDELSAFKFAPPLLRRYEQELLQQADVVFTGGQSLYNAKKDAHPNVHAFPSSIDKDHFMQARHSDNDPADQAHLPHPRLGFYGVLDERLDVELVRYIAQARPQWQLVLVGPVVKIDPATLPQLPNIHYTGSKSYNELPQYLAGWDVALLCFALNESTRFISPTKTPEYLAAGKPVVSTAITDVVHPYGEKGLVRIAHSPQEFVEHVEAALAETDTAARMARADQFLANSSWDQTAAAMLEQVRLALEQKTNASPDIKEEHYV